MLEEGPRACQMAPYIPVYEGVSFTKSSVTLNRLSGDSQIDDDDRFRVIFWSEEI